MSAEQPPDSPPAAEPRGAEPRGRWLWRRPLLLCAVCFLLGIAAADHGLVGLVPAAVACLSAALVAVLTPRARPIVSSVALLCAFAFLGAFLHSARLVVPRSDISRLAGASSITIEGVVTSPPETRGRRSSFSLRVEGVRPSFEVEPVTGQVQAHAPSAPVSVGDRVRLSGARVARPAGAETSGGFDYARWLRRRGITAEVTAESVALLDDAASPRAPGIMPRVAAAIEAAMPGPDADLYAHLLLGMVYGLEAQPLPESTVDDFRRAGTVHLLVVSGAQVSMLVIAVLWLAGVRWRSARWWHLLPVVAALAGLVLIVGMGESVTRAVAMFALLAVAALTARDYDLATAIGFAALLVCLVDSNALFSLGFQLTFAATIGVVVFLPPEPLRMINRSFAPRSVQALRYALWGTVGAWVLVTPLLAHAFSGFPLLGNIANLVNVPLSGLIMVLGFVALPFALLHSALPWVVWQGALTGLCAVSRAALDVVMGVNWLAGSLPLAYVEGVELSALGVVLWYALVVALVLSDLLERGRRRLDRPLALMHPSWVPIAGAAVIVVIWLGQALSALPPRGLEVTFLPVGAGQCAVVRSPSGANLMVDCGGRLLPADSGDRLAAEVIRPWLSRHRVRRLDLVVVSHWDADHYNALAALLPGMRWGRALLPPDLPEVRRPEELRGLLDARSEPLRTGGLIHLGPTVRAEVLAPRTPWLWATRDDANNNSAVLRLTCGGRALLLSGDLQAAGIERLERDAAAGRCELRADVLCLPHHGRSLPDCLRLVELVRPRWAVASCDRQADHYLGPSGEQALAERGVRLLRTDRQGAITFVTDGRSLRVRTSGAAG